jgi:hypothetical protein
MKQVTETALTYIIAAHPHTELIERDGKKIARVPTYDAENDIPGVIEKEIIPDPDQTPMGILPVFNIRTGPKFNPDGDAKVSPLGKLYRIIGYTPPPKKDDDE